jgi:hypothetical protein
MARHGSVCVKVLDHPIETVILGVRALPCGDVVGMNLTIKIDWQNSR